MRGMLGAAVLLAACHFDGSGVAIDGAPAGGDGALVDGALVDAAEVPADAAVDAVPDAATCPATYSRVDGLPSLYRFVVVGDDWLAAELDCEDDGATTGGGTHLVVLDNATEVAGLDPLLTELAWIGVSDRVTEDSYFRVTGGVSTFPGFRSGEPNDGGPFGVEDCVELNGAELNDEGCGELRRYVCECDGVPAIPAAYTPESDLAPR